MDHQDEGWPLGLRLLNARVVLQRHRNFSGSVSFSSLITGSLISSPDSCSDPDTQSTGSFFHGKNITLGSLIGISNILELSRRSLRGRAVEVASRDQTRNYQKMKPWMFSLCSRLRTDAVRVGSAQSLAQYLEAERRAAASKHRKDSLQENLSYPPK